MNKVELKRVDKPVIFKGDLPDLEPDITEDSLFYEKGELIGFYIKKVSGRTLDFLTIANKEFRSDRVPKTLMVRGLSGDMIGKGIRNDLGQYSSIIGSVAPKPHMRRLYPSKSSVHLTKSSKTFTKAMLCLAKESEKIVERIMPEQYARQLELIKENVPEKWRFANMFTSSISNFNISAKIHMDRANIKGCSNVIFSVKKQATGGNLHLPEYNVTIESGDGSMIYYPAWRNLHGVTPIVPTAKGGYRNSLIFYPLKAFKGLD